MWTEICQRFSDANTATSRINLCIKLYKERLKEGEMINDFISRLINYQNQLKDTTQAVTDDDLVLHILRVLPPKYAGIARHIKEHPQDQLTLEYVSDTLLDFDRFEACTVAPSEAQALTTQQKDRSQKKKDRRVANCQKTQDH